MHSTRSTQFYLIENLNAAYLEQRCENMCFYNCSGVPLTFVLLHANKIFAISQIGPSNRVHRAICYLDTLNDCCFSAFKTNFSLMFFPKQTKIYNFSKGIFT